MKKSLSLLSLISVALIGCSTDNSETVSTKDQLLQNSSFTNTAVYNATITPSEIQSDLIKLSALGSLPMNTGLPGNTNAAPPSVNCTTIPMEPQTQTQTDNGVTATTTFTMHNGANQPIQVCEGQTAISLAFNMNGTIVGDSLEGSFEGRGTESINTQSGTLSANIDYAYRFVKSGLDVNADVKMIMSGNTNNNQLSMQVYSLMHLLKDKYRCYTEFSLDQNTINTPQNAEMCDLTHNGQVVGKIKNENGEMAFYDVSGNKVTQLK